MPEQSDEVPRPPARPAVGIIFNQKKGTKGKTPDAEAEYDNIDTVYAIERALCSGGFETVLLEGDGTLPKALAETHIDIAFNIAEGIRGRGREAEVPALLNMLGIPFTGSDETALCIALDKALCKRLLATYRIRTPKYAVVGADSAAGTAKLRFPVIVKPDAEGSSKGIPDACIASNRAELREMLKRTLGLYDGPMLVEEYIEGREFTVGILGNGRETRVFPPMEIVFKRATNGGYRVYSYDVKQDYKKFVDYQCPADLSAEQENEIKSAALRAYRALGCRDLARIDFRMDADGNIYFIEMNPLPGLAPGYSDFPMLAEFSGVPYDELVRGILHTAMSRLGMEAAK